MCDKVTSIESFLNELPRMNKKMTGMYFYRGHSDSKYDLLPSVFRKNNRDHENNIFDLAITECSKEFDGIVAHADILSKMQHFGIPTRLLDITGNPLVALYFACENNFSKDGSVHILHATNKVLPYDSDKASLLACLPRFSIQEQRELIRLIQKAMCQHQSGLAHDQIEYFNSNKIVKRLLHEVRKEKPAFSSVIVPEDLLNFYFYAPKKNTDRIIRQSGAFIIFGLDYNQPTSRQIIIDACSKQKIRDQLSCFGISKASLFPELYKVAEYIKEKYK